MKASVPLLFAAAIALAACRDSASATRKSQQYDVVQEGAASGVTSTINGPGETNTAVVNTPMTSTNADTTTAFAVSTDIVPEGAPGSIAGTLPSQPAPGAMGSPAPSPGAIRVYVPPSPRRAPSPQQQTATTSRPSRTATDAVPPMHSSSTATQPPVTETQPAPSTDTQAAPATDTQTQTAPPENTKKKKAPPPPPPDDEAPPPPPPSTSTSTIGPG